MRTVWLALGVWFGLSCLVGAGYVFGMEAYRHLMTWRRRYRWWLAGRSGSDARKITLSAQAQRARLAATARAGQAQPPLHVVRDREPWMGHRPRRS